ncbi:ferritin-like domain-containing protein [Clostridium beijerinckii]|uniref:Rubrerythrin n=1 Tax=Clostridium beijerinckii TaxID=1520 RepID=A0AAX0AXR6_CLOBE|nr:ferritin family protein [Clostridium beijerinckii]NRT72330.1 rubrerythrin [Clostridium beijerinckii]NRT86964.1 rubrerythrin [Clostridium beijerinckii]NYC72396.1 rubrerythrin [Clostridium beijerinckii]
MSLIGLTKGTDLEEKINEMWKAEAIGAATYQAFAIVAQEKGLSELADELKKISADEARHGGLYAALNGHTNENLRDALSSMSIGEISAGEKIKELSKILDKSGLKEAAQAVHTAGEDECRHGEILKELIEKYL